MRSFLVFAVLVGLGLTYLWQKRHEAPPDIAKAPKVVVTQPTPAPRGQASEYNWMKRSLDRARDVTEKSRAQTKESQEQ
jgi:hypothetical protein